MPFFKRGRKDNEPGAVDDKAWYRTLPGELYRQWPKRDGEPEEPVFLTHCSALDMADELLIGMLSAYGIPAVRHYPSNGSFGVVVLGISADGTDIYVPASMLEDAAAIIGGNSDD